MNKFIQRKTIAALIILLAVIITSVILFLLKNDNSHERDQASIKTETTALHHNNANTSFEQRLTEYNELPIEGYKITSLDRQSPCSASYTTLKSMARPGGEVSQPVRAFIETAVGEGKLSILSTQARTIVSEAYQDATPINEKYKFGEITRDERDAVLNELELKTKSSFDKLKLSKWNDAIDLLAADHNSRIVNGQKEDCFDSLKLTTTSFDDYFSRERLEYTN